MHYFVGLVVDDADQSIEEIEDLMEPYDDNLEVPEYEEECDCVGDVARCHASIVALKENSSKFVELWHEAYSSHWLRDIPRKDCDCEGSGIRTSTCNPDGRWDWFVIGGRWDECVKGIKAEAEDDLGPGNEKLKNNIISIKDYLKIIKEKSEKIYWMHAIVFPGNWVGISELQTNCERLTELLLPYKDRWIVGLDCHS